MTKTITLTDEEYKKVQKVLGKKEVEEKSEAKTIIYKKDGSVLFESTKDSLKEAVEEAVNRGADLLEADLLGADLRGADLRGADLRETDLGGTNLRGADLREADLLGADLRGADLWGADLWGAELRNVKFYGKGGTIKLKKEQLTDFLNALGFQLEDE